MLKKIASIMRLDDTTWLRHANPWSVWTRVLGLLILIISIWSRIWIGYYSLIPTVLSIIWIWINPRFFSPPINYLNWATQSVLGERAFLAIPPSELPSHHRLLPKILNLISAVGAILIAISLYELNINHLLTGTIVQLGSKLWYLDRMVWLYTDVKSNPKYLIPNEQGIKNK